MSYIYPKFSKYELPGVRFGGPGLGNLLFIYARALALSEKYDLELIWPTWASLKIGPWIRNERDKRFYGDLFANNSDAISGMKKYCILTSKKKVILPEDEDEFRLEMLGKEDVLIYSNFKMRFDELKGYYTTIRNNIFLNLGEKAKKAELFDCKDSLNVHIRLGDFKPANGTVKPGLNNMRIPIQWYVLMIKMVREAAKKELRVNVFSDGSDDELKDVLELDNTHRVSFGNSLADIVALSKSPCMIASGSSFSMWARFLGQQSSISYPGQIKESVLVPSQENKFEIELADDNCLDNHSSQLIFDMYNRRV